MKAKTVFITLKFDHIDKMYDYPQNVPLPRIGETVVHDDGSGVVYSVRHVSSGNMTEVRILAKWDI